MDRLTILHSPSFYMVILSLNPSYPDLLTPFPCLQVD